MCRWSLESLGGSSSLSLPSSIQSCSLCIEQGDEFISFPPNPDVLGPLKLLRPLFSDEIPPAFYAIET